MLKDKERLCDVCGETIPKRQKYAVSIIPKDQAKNADLMLPGDVPRTMDANGNLRLDICLDCKMNMGTPSEGVQ
jgi:hypothetical protein